MRKMMTILVLAFVLGGTLTTLPRPGGVPAVWAGEDGGNE
jgi:hypothetical protein